MENTLAGHSPPPLRMVVVGEGGTGKSRLMQTLTAEFARRRAHALLVKGAYTGIAACVINGETLHKLGGFGVKTKKVAGRKVKMMEQYWRDKKPDPDLQGGVLTVEHEYLIRRRERHTSRGLSPDSACGDFLKASVLPYQRQAGHGRG